MLQRLPEFRSDELEVEVDGLQLNDRAADIWKPIFAVLRTIGADGDIRQLKALAREMASDPEAHAEDLRKLTIIQTLETTRKRHRGTYRYEPVRVGRMVA